MRSILPCSGALRASRPSRARTTRSERTYSRAGELRAAELRPCRRRSLERPAHILSLRLSPLGVSRAQVQAIVDATGPSRSEPGFTFSDLTQRLLPAIALDAYPDRAVEGPRALPVRTGQKAPPAAPP